MLANILISGLTLHGWSSTHNDLAGSIMKNEPHPHWNRFGPLIVFPPAEQEGVGVWSFSGKCWNQHVSESVCLNDKGSHQIGGEKEPDCGSIVDLWRTLYLRNESSDLGIVRCSNILTSPPLKMNQVWFHTIWSSWKALISSPPFSCWASCLLSWDCQAWINDDRAHKCSLARSGSKCADSSHDFSIGVFSHHAVERVCPISCWRA